MPSLWQFLGMHLVLSIQKAHQSLHNNKGHTVLVFDREDTEAIAFTSLISEPPAWTDTYYGRSRKQPALDQIVDVPLFSDSHRVGLLQVADVAAFFLRKHLELSAGKAASRYPGEDAQVRNWAEGFLAQSIPRSNIYLSRGRCRAADLFYKYAPALYRDRGAAA